MTTCPHIHLQAIMSKVILACIPLGCKLVFTYIRYTASSPSGLLVLSVAFRTSEGGQ